MQPGAGLGVGTVIFALGLRQWLGKTRLEQVIFESDTPAGKSFDLGLLIGISLSVLLVELESDAPLDVALVPGSAAPSESSPPFSAWSTCCALSAAARPCAKGAASLAWWICSSIPPR